MTPPPASLFDIASGSRRQFNVEVAKLYDFTHMAVPVEVVRGKKDGPTLFLSAAIHGDEINGVDIIRRLLKHKRLAHLRGRLIAVPIVNIYGFNTKSRYLPDRRDLNRCFPGDAEGSLAHQLAYTFMEQVVARSDYGIDLHTGAIHRSNLPQIRGYIDDPEVMRLAQSFHVPVIINASLRDGSLRQAAQERKIPTLLYEGGEALRFNLSVIKTGVKGILSVMETIGMLPESAPIDDQGETFVARSSHWLRAPHSGTLSVRRRLGDRIRRGELLGVVSDPFGRHSFEIHAKHPGIIVGMSMIPLVNEGDALFHIATFEDAKAVEESIELHPDITIGQTETYVL